MEMDGNHGNSFHSTQTESESHFTFHGHLISTVLVITPALGDPRENQGGKQSQLTAVETASFCRFHEKNETVE